MKKYQYKVGWISPAWFSIRKALQSALNSCGLSVQPQKRLLICITSNFLPQYDPRGIHTNEKRWLPAKITPVKPPKEIQTKTTPLCAMQVILVTQLNSCAQRVQQGKYEEPVKGLGSLLLLYLDWWPVRIGHVIRLPPGLHLIEGWEGKFWSWKTPCPPGERGSRPNIA